MIIKAEQKYIRMSPRKLRLVADVVRKLGSPKMVLSYLENINKRAARPISKVIKQAMANAKNNAGAAEGELRIKEFIINQGPVYKRFRPVSRGRAHSIKKRTSHIKVILETKAQRKQNGKRPSTIQYGAGKTENEEEKKDGT